MSIHKWLVSDNIELSQQHSSCHPYDVTSDHPPLPIARNHAWRDHSALSPIAVLVNSRSLTTSAQWDTRPTDVLTSDEKLPTSSQQNIHGSYPKTSVVGKSLQTPHDVRSNAMSTLERLKFSLIGQELPPLSTTVTIKHVQTPNQLIQMLQLATHKLNELHGTYGKQNRLLRLYNLSEFNCYSMGVISSAPSISELALCMKTTSTTLKKWYTMFKNALVRDFDFIELGNERIKDHYSFFYPADQRYQISDLGERAIEQYFRQVGKQVFKDSENSREDTSRDLTNRGDLTELDGFTRPSNVVDEAAKTRQFPSVLHLDEMGEIRFSETPPPKDARCEPAAILHSGNEDQLLDTTSPFNRYFRINAACLAKVQIKHDDTKIQLDSVPKRLKAGSKDRMLCMVLGCEKHTQAQCKGCCSSHFRMLSSTAALTEGKEKKVSLFQTIDCISFVPEVASANLLQCIIYLI
jgi:hypothetical protein